MKHLEDWICRNGHLLQDYVVDCIYAAASSLNYCFSTLYAADVWVPAAVAHDAASAGLTFLNNYDRLARHFYEQKKLRFPLKPKLHYIHHCFDDMITFSLKNPYVLNPLCESNQMNEEPW